MLCIVGNNDNAKGCVMDVDIRWRATHVVHIGQLIYTIRSSSAKAVCNNTTIILI